MYEPIDTEQETNQPPKPLWFQVAGDLDDFIFFGEPDRPCSQR